MYNIGFGSLLFMVFNFLQRCCHATNSRVFITSVLYMVAHPIRFAVANILIEKGKITISLLVAVTVKR